MKKKGLGGGNTGETQKGTNKEKKNGIVAGKHPGPEKLSGEEPKNRLRVIEEKRGTSGKEFGKIRTKGVNSSEAEKADCGEGL